MSRAVEDNLEPLSSEDENSSDETSEVEIVEEILQDRAGESLKRRIIVEKRKLQRKSQSHSHSSIKDNFGVWRTMYKYRFEFVQCRSASAEMCEESMDGTTPLDYWSLLLTDAIINQIVSDTNEEIEGNHIDADKRKTTSLEIKALIALFYIRGMLKSPCDLWSPHCETIAFRAAMTAKRYMYLKSKLNFHLSDDIAQEDKNEYSVENCDVWEDFIGNCQRRYVPSQYCTIGTQSLNDLDIVMINDASGYMINAMFLKQNVETKPMESLAAYYVRQLSRPIDGRIQNRRNCLSSMDIIDQMCTKHRLRVTSAINKDDMDIPQSFKKVCIPGPTILRFDKNNFLTSHTLKDREMNVMTSLLNQDTENDEKTRKPSVVITYDNKMKTGTYLFNKMCRRYTVAEKTNRRSLRIFYSMLDQACINSFVLYHLNKSNTLLSFENFLFALSDSLLKLFVIEPTQVYESNKDIRDCKIELLGDKMRTL